MNTKELMRELSLFENAKEDIRRIKDLFQYDTLDEVDPKYERIMADVTIEIGGPSVHIKTGIRTREEHTILLTALTTILSKRVDDSERSIVKWAKEQTYQTQEPF